MINFVESTTRSMPVFVLRGVFEIAHVDFSGTDLYCTHPDPANNTFKTRLQWSLFMIVEHNVFLME